MVLASENVSRASRQRPPKVQKHPKSYPRRLLPLLMIAVMTATSVSNAGSDLALDIGGLGRLAQVTGREIR